MQPIITLTGPDGVGKTLHANILAREICRAYNIIDEPDPYGSRPPRNLMHFPQDSDMILKSLQTYEAGMVYIKRKLHVIEDRVYDQYNRQLPFILDRLLAIGDIARKLSTLSCPLIMDRYDIDSIIYTPAVPITWFDPLLSANPYKTDICICLYGARYSRMPVAADLLEGSCLDILLQSDIKPDLVEEELAFRCNVALGRNIKVRAINVAHRSKLEVHSAILTFLNTLLQTNLEIASADLEMLLT